MNTKQQVVQMYLHLRRFLTPEETIQIVKSKLKVTHDLLNDVAQLEQIRKTKMLNAKFRGSLDKYYYTY